MFFFFAFNCNMGYSKISAQKTNILFDEYVERSEY